MEKIETVLTRCIQEIKSGQVTLEECLNRYPSRRQELEPLLRVALSIQKPPVIQMDPNYKQSARAQLLKEISQSKPRKSHSTANRFSFEMPPQPVWARVAISILIVVIVLTMLGGSTAYASQSSLPGDLLYPVKLNTEEARILLAGDSAAKAELNLEFAQTRLNEMRKVSLNNAEKTGLAVKGYQENLAAADNQLSSVTDITTLQNLLIKFSAALQNQVIFSDGVIDSNPANLEEVRRANDVTISQQLAIIHKLAPQDIRQAMEINLEAMGKRLERAQERANNNQYATMQQVMLQYQQFNQLGEQLLESARNTNNQATIEDLSSRALQNYLNILTVLSGEIPQEYQNIIETSREQTLQFQNRLQYQYQHQGDSGQGANNSSPIEGNGPSPEPATTSVPQGPEGNGNKSDENPGPVTTPSQGNGGNTGYGNGTSDPTSSPLPNTNENPDSGNINGGDGNGNGSDTSSGNGADSGSDSTPVPGPSGSKKP